MIFTIPLASYGIYNTVKTEGIHPWVSWSNTHSHFSRVDVVPASVWRNNPGVARELEYHRWELTIPPVVFFAFCGFAEEARHSYHAAFWRVVGWLRYAPTRLASNGYGSLLRYSSNDTNADNSRETKRSEDPTNLLPVDGAPGRTETVAPAKHWMLRFFSFLAKFLHLHQKQPLLPIQFAPHIVTSQSSYFSPSSSNVGGGRRSQHAIQISVGEAEAPTTGTLNESH